MFRFELSGFCLAFLLISHVPSPLLGQEGLDARGQVILDSSSLKEVVFDDVKPTLYKREQGILNADVQGSSSLLLLPFKEKRQVSGLRFSWSCSGSLLVTSAKQQRTKEGDDFFLRLGLLLSGPKPWLPFFAPSWVNLIAKNMHLPFDRILYLVPGSLQKDGDVWPSPFSDKMEYQAISSRESEEKDAWKVSDVRFIAKEVVGMWIMSDGDNTKSRFSCQLKNLFLQ